MVVIKGAYTYKRKKYGPGSYLFIPGGDKHESGGVAILRPSSLYNSPACLTLSWLSRRRTKNKTTGDYRVPALIAAVSSIVHRLWQTPGGALAV